MGARGGRGGRGCLFWGHGGWGWVADPSMIDKHWVPSLPWAQKWRRVWIEEEAC